MRARTSLLLPLLAAFALVCAQGAACAAVPHFELSIALDPSTRVLRVAGTIAIPAGRALALSLAARFDVTRFELEGGAAPPSEEGSGNTRRWHVRAPPGSPATIRLAYEGVLPPLAELDHRAALGLSHPVSGPEGAFLPAGTGWYPEPEGERLTYRLELSVPAPGRALVPGRLVRETVSASGYLGVFETSVPLPGIDLVAGPYVVRERMAMLEPGRLLRLRTWFHPELDALAATYLDAAEAHLGRYQREIGPYAFDAYNIVSSVLPTGFGMPGLAYLGRRVLQLPFIPATSLRHEVLHDWWGNGVVPDVAQGNWAEGLTTLLADHALREEQGDAEARALRLAWLRDFAALAPAQDRPLARFVARRHGADQAVGYGKGAFVFFMLRDRIGEAAFRAGLRRFWREHRLHTASWRDLKAAFEAETGAALGAFFAQWVGRNGAPSIALAEARRAGSTGVDIVLRQSGAPYELDVPVRIGHEQGALDVRIAMTGESAQASFGLPARALWVEIDPEVRIFRRLDPDEIVPTLRPVLLDPDTRVVLAATAASERAAAEVVARAALEGGVRLQQADGPRPAAPLLVVGVHGEVHRILARWQLPSRTVPGATQGSAYAYAARTADGIPFAVVAAPDADALRALARPLPHLGAQSYAVFDGARSIARGVWPHVPRRHRVRD